MFGVLLALIQVLKLLHMCLLELEHHQLALIFHQLFLKSTEDVKRTSQMCQEDLFVSLPPIAADGLE